MTFTSAFTPAEQPAYALRTQDGGAVAWYALKQQEAYKGKKIPVSGELAGLLPGGQIARKSLTSTSLLQYLAAVPQEVLTKIVARIPVGRLGHAEEIARAVKFLCSEDAGFVTGSTMSVNGGQHMY